MLSMRVPLSGRAWLTCLSVAAVLAVAGCTDADPEPPPLKPARADDPVGGGGNLVQVGKNIWLELRPGRRRVLVTAEVCLRRGVLELFLTRKDRKEHEAVLAADIDARKLHEALLLAGAQAGSPARWLPRYRPASGSPIQVSLSYDVAGARKIVPARSWVRNLTTGKELDSDWVFAGSLLADGPLGQNGPKAYLANQGDVICVANFPAALLDLPVRSSTDDSDRLFEAWTERIPVEGTKVTVALELGPRG